MYKIRFWVRDRDKDFHFVAQSNVDVVDEVDESIAHVIWTEEDIKELQHVFSEILSGVVVSKDTRDLDSDIRGAPRG